LARRHLLSADRPNHTVEQIAGTLVGLHATDPATPYLSLWARSSDFVPSDLDTAIYQRRNLVKHLAMRRTLWVVRAVDLPYIQSAASDRVAANEHKRLAADAQKAGLSADGAAWVDTACAAVLRYIDAHGPTSAKALREALPELAGTYDAAPGKSWGGEGPIAPRVLTVLGVRGHIVRGPNDGRWTVSRPLWASAADWLGTTHVPPDDAAATLVRTWLRAFGPATVTDIKWWFGNTLTWARQALRDIEAVEVDLDGNPGYVLADDLDEEPEVKPWAALLPSLDPTTMGWFDREWYLGGHRSQVFDTNGNAGPTVWWNGQVAGAWRQDPEGRVELRLLDDVGREGRRALTACAENLTNWLDGVRISPRFPSPLSKASEWPPA
jgi:hypothetical protein